MKLQHSAINILDLVIIYKQFSETQKMSLYINKNCEYFYKNCTIKSFKSLFFRNFKNTFNSIHGILYI